MTEKTTPAESKRQIKNLLIAPRFQLRLCLYYAISGVVFLGVVVAFALQSLLEVQSLMNANPVMDFQIQSRVNELMFQTVQFSLFGFVAYIAFTSVFALIISHRIAGPVVAIVAFIEQLKLGNYRVERKLRPHDELQEVMSGLHDLASTLRSNSESRS